MLKSEFVLSNTSTFFGGRIEAVFKKARKHGFKHLEIFLYRWAKPEKVLALLEEKYGIRVVGIHMPQHWNRSAWQILKTEPDLISAFFTLLYHFYTGKAAASRGFKLAELLQKQGRSPYLVLHANLLSEIPEADLKMLNQKFRIAIENVPRLAGKPEYFWNPAAAKQTLSSALVFDPSHYLSGFNPHPPIPAPEMFRLTGPEILHIGYEHGFIFRHHVGPDEKEAGELTAMLKVHTPKYIVIETNPAVNPGKTKALIESLIP